jgi:hypothetical protein
MGTPPPAGWFTSPDADGMQRWWDGAGWTSCARPTPAPALAPADVPTQRPDPTLPTDPAEQLEKTTEALAALQQQGGLMGAFAAVASQALQSQLPPPMPTGPGVEPYGRRAFGTPVPSSGGDDGAGTSISWRAGPFSGGQGPDDDLGNRRRRSTRSGPVNQLVVGLLFLVLGLGMAVFLMSDNSTHADESTVTATVVDHEIRVSSKGERTCAPVASFSVGGATYTATSHISSSSGCPDIGSSVTVIYTTDAPGDGDARVQSTDATFWVVIWIFPIVGLVLVIFAVRRLGVLRRVVRVLRGE